jgi:hypothetical protein
LVRRFRRRDADHDLISSSELSVDHRVCGPTESSGPSVPVHSTDRNEENTMDPQLIEWGPAHLRDEATTLDVEPDDRPDDN